ncbi:hypothetical protein DIJ64_02160 [Mycobacterium leprae]|uniref:Transposase n=1 Tax=Mycobacterium leprae TaxID=1769 RepID=A0AAD0KSV5_MYCLR|nr:hypothetical protein DIJ64_02160 [Mycobacterium leprae]
MGLSKSQVSVMAKELDTVVDAFRTCPLDAGPYTHGLTDVLVSRFVRPVPCGQCACSDHH